MIDNNKFGLLIIVITIFQTDCIRFRLINNDPTCFRIPGKNSYMIEYVISGKSDKKVKTEVYDN
jgi:hypothetical protein